MALKDGFSKERYQAMQLGRPFASVAAIDLKDAAATVEGRFYVPSAWGSITIKKLGIIMAAAGGAQTTAGALKLQKNGVDITDSAGTVLEVASVASHSAGAVVEIDLNNTLSANNLVSAPNYPTLAAGDVLTWVIKTQGVGAGDQTAFPYILFSETPGQA